MSWRKITILETVESSSLSSESQIDFDDVRQFSFVFFRELVSSNEVLRKRPKETAVNDPIYVDEFQAFRLELSNLRIFVDNVLSKIDAMRVRPKVHPLKCRFGALD